MPQPLKRIIRGDPGKILMGLDNVAKRPELAAKAFTVIAYMASVDAILAQLAATITMGKAEPVVAYFVEQESNRTKFATLETLARSHLEADRLNLFSAVFKVYRHTQALRNPIAHGIWGVCEKLPNALLVSDPRDELRIDAEAKSILAERTKAALANKVAMVTTLDAKYDQLNQKYQSILKVYRDKDFDDIIREIAAVRKLLIDLHRVVQRDADEPPRGGQSKFQQLIRQPEIQNLL